MSVLMGAITLLVGVAAALFYSNLSDARKEFREEVRVTRDTTNLQISAIRDVAQTAAKSEAQKTAEAELDKQNVQAMIEAAAQKKADVAVDEAVRKNLGARIETFRTLVKRSTDIASHAAQLRLGSRAAVNYLLNSRNDPDPEVRELARSTLKTIGAEFQSKMAKERPVDMGRTFIGVLAPKSTCS